jgi:hypothetical protein
LAIGQGIVWLGQAVLDAMSLAGSLEGIAASGCGRSRAVLRQIGELDAVLAFASSRAKATFAVRAQLGDVDIRWCYLLTIALSLLR